MKSKINISLLTLFLSALLFTACEDESPLNYNKEYYIEGYLIVDEPIQGIKVMATQPYYQKLEWDSAYITENIDVKIMHKDKTYELEFRREEPAGYYLPDSSIKVLPGENYQLVVNLTEDGKSYTMTGQTTTPQRISWVKPPKDVFQYPTDTLNLPVNPDLSLEWTNEENTSYYLICVKHKDTLDYGKYLNPPEHDNKNRRVYSILKNHDELFKDVTAWNMIGNTKTPTVWLAFRWFGPLEVSVWATDPNMFNWFKQTVNNMGTEYIPNLNSIQGDGFGVFGSASVIKKDCFLLKNQK